MADALMHLVSAAAVSGMLRAGLSPRDAFAAAGWGDPADDGAPPGVPAPFAVAARLAHGTGAALAPVLDACAIAAREEAEAELAREVALAGPRLSARVLAWLPVVGLGLAVLVDGSTLRVFVTPIGLGLLGVGSALTLLGRWWMRRLVRNARAVPDATVLMLHAVRAAMAAGADVASALAAVSLALSPESGFAAEAQRMRAVALALAHGDEWDTAWSDAALPALETALRLPWERGALAAPLLVAVAQGESLALRRAAQVAASELAVRLTLPLAACLLPAFVVMGIVPLLVSLIGGLE